MNYTSVIKIIRIVLTYMVKVGSGSYISSYGGYIEKNTATFTSSRKRYEKKYY